MFPCCVQWPLGGIFHSAQACALGLGFQGLGLSPLHLLPLLGSIPHAVNLLCGLGCPSGGQAERDQLSVCPRRSQLGGRWPQMAQCQLCMGGQSHVPAQWVSQEACVPDGGPGLAAARAGGGGMGLCTQARQTQRDCLARGEPDVGERGRVNCEGPLGAG